MVKNREPQKEAVESQSESGEEEESGEELEDASSDEVNSQGSDSEPEQSQLLKKHSTPTPQKQIKVSNKATPVIPAPAQSSSSEEESGSESESESESELPEQKSISGPKKPSSAAPATTSIVVKRPAEEKESEGRDAKKAKKVPDSPVVKNANANDDPKKSLFQRLWSQDDEIVILNGMVEYSNKKKLDPKADLSAFLDFIKEKLHVDVSRTQLQDKIRRLKKKFENNIQKEKDGKGRTPAKGHEQKTYELSKLVWGTDAGSGENGVGSPKANGSAVKKAPSKKAAASAAAAENEEARDSKSGVIVSVKREKTGDGLGSISIGGMSVDERVMRAGEELFVREGVEGKEEWMKLKTQEIELHVKQMEVKLAQSKLVLGAMKSRDC